MAASEPKTTSRLYALVRRTAPTNSNSRFASAPCHGIARGAARGTIRRLLAPPAGAMRGGDIQSLPLEVRVAAQRAWMEENGYGQRSAVEFIIGALKETFGGHVSARRPGPVAHEIARKAIIYNAGCP